MQIPAVVINLTRQPERYAWFTEKARQANLTVERLAAVDAKAPENADLIESFRSHDQALSPVEAACFLSHRRAWEYAIASGSPYLAIFEDDVHLSQDLSQLLDLGAIPPRVDLIKMEVPSGKVACARKSSAAILNRKLHRLLTRAYGAGAYIISRQCAHRLLELTNNCAEPVDVFLFDDFGQVFREYPILQIVPAPCIQDVNFNLAAPENNLFTSSIEEERKERKKTRHSKQNTKRFKTLRRYFRNLLIGESIFLKKQRIPLDLGSPSEG